MPAENSLEQKITPSPERVDGKGALESALERSLEKIEEPKKEKKVERPEVAVSPSAPTDDAAVADDDYHRRRELAIDSILADGLDQVYLKMSPADQKRFKEEGERTAATINRLLDKAKAAAGKIIGLIKRWLGLIPGANKYFLEQEAKIKADRIMKIKRNL